MKIICREVEMIYFEMKSLFFCLIKRTKNQGDGWLWIRGVWFMNEIYFREVEMIYSEMSSLFFSLMKRTKNQGFGIVVKAQFSVFFNWFSLRGALFCSLLKSLILSVICCAASSKSLAFQFVHKTQQSQGQKGDLELGVRICTWNKFFCDFEMYYFEM